MDRTVIRELGRALRVLGEHGDRLDPTTATTQDLDEIAGDIQRARRILAQAERPIPLTNCREHPYGPVQPDTADECLICVIRRRRHTQLAAHARR